MSGFYDAASQPNCRPSAPKWVDPFWWVKLWVKILPNRIQIKVKSQLIIPLPQFKHLGPSENRYTLLEYPHDEF